MLSHKHSFHYLFSFFISLFFFFTIFIFNLIIRTRNAARCNNRDSRGAFRTQSKSYKEFLQKYSINDARLSSKDGSAVWILLLQTLFQPLLYLKYFTSFKIAFRVQIWKKILYFENLFRKTAQKTKKKKKKGNFTFLKKSLEPDKLNKILFLCSNVVCQWSLIWLTSLHQIFLLSIVIIILI